MTVKKDFFSKKFFLDKMKIIIRNEFQEYNNNKNKQVLSKN
jgi:hypothetical protein